MQHLLPLAVILLLSIIPVETEVVASVEHCNEFFLQQTPPQIPRILEGGIIRNRTRYKWICQTLHNNRIFVTLYDTKNKIPVFSAAKYRGDDGGRRPRTEWMIEPQLENIHDENGNMMKAEKGMSYKNQAVTADYSSDCYDKGHLFPSSYGSSHTEKKSTFTLTNTVPQKKSFNQVRWNNMEKCVKCILDKYCKNKETYVVIGAEASRSNFLNGKINIPSMLWSAFCCSGEGKDSSLASAHWGDNEEQDQKYLQTQTLAELYKELKGNFKVFPSTCPLHTTVTHLYSDLPNTCSCPQTTHRRRWRGTSAPFTNTSTPLVSSSVKVSVGKRPLTKGKSFLSKSHIKITEFVKNEKLISVRDVKVKLKSVFEQLKPNA